MSKKKKKAPKMPMMPGFGKMPEFKFPEFDPTKCPGYIKPEDFPKPPMMDEKELAKFQELIAQIIDPMSYENSLNAMYFAWAEKWLPMFSCKEKKKFKKFVLPYLAQAEEKAAKAAKKAAEEAPAEEAAEAPAEAPAEEAAE